mmetsp:Transcript_8454/g.16165  ORF Transcript_8454/g.16165 Transcript_8454/m.16165 type:complete len:134 (+) Transcript_8454:191-592(+)
MISASVTDEVPWGFVCGYPTRKGDLYGGAHYMQSSSADMTPQGRAIRDVSIRFGNARTLPFTPCKKGFIPFANGERKYACPLHNKERRRRVLGAGGAFRKGELDLNMFWKRYEAEEEAQDAPAKVEKEEESAK